MIYKRVDVVFHSFGYKNLNTFCRKIKKKVDLKIKEVKLVSFQLIRFIAFLDGVVIHLYVDFLSHSQTVIFYSFLTQLRR